MQMHLKATKDASLQLLTLSDSIKKAVLQDLANTLLKQSKTILTANQRDLDNMSESDPKYDRLKLTPTRIEAISQTLNSIAALDSPIGKVLEEFTLANGLYFQKKTVPLGVVGLIFEARPNVTIEAFALCFMSSNACVLKGGSDAKYSNLALVHLIQGSLARFSLAQEIVLLLSHEREAVNALFKANKWVDVIIPRGSQSLIDFVRKNSEVPVIETGAGVVHTYFDISGDLTKGKAIITNAKTRRVSVCNALDCLIIHENRLSDLFDLISPLAQHKVKLHVDNQAKAYLTDYPQDQITQASSSDFGTEFLSYDLAIKTVKSLEEAISHIRQFSSFHSEAIIAEDQKAIDQFFAEVDAAVVYANASTAFTDGGEFGMGSEIGISTQKLHVRGPFSMQHLVSTKWIVQGDGQIRA